MRLFVAALPDAAVVQYLMQVYGGWPRPEIEGLRWTGPDQWHVTLRFLGLADPAAATAALDQLEPIIAEARLGPTTALFGRSILMVPVVGVDSLAGAVTAVTLGVGEPPEDRPFVGHLTLARSRGWIPPELVDAPVAGMYPVTEVCLMRSETLAEGARYEVLGRWSLRS